MFPLGVPGDKDFSYTVVAGREIKPRKPSDYNAKIQELREMAQDKSLQNISTNWTAINNYMALNKPIKMAQDEDYNYPADYDYWKTN